MAGRKLAAGRKRQPNGAGSSRQLVNGTWEVKRRVRGERLYGYGASYDEAAADLRAKVEKIRIGVDPAAGDKPLRALLDAWLATSPGQAPATRRSYADTVRLHLIPKLGDIPLDHLTAAHVEGMMRQGLAAGLSARTVGYHRAVLRLALNYAIKARLLVRNEADLADAPAWRSRKAVPLTIKEAEALLAHVAGTRWHGLYATALYTGLRAGELLGLRWTDVDLEAGELHVRRQAQFVTGGGVVLREVKTESSAQSVPLARDAALILVAHRDLLQREGLYAVGGMVFPSSDGAVMAPSALVRRWRGGKRDGKHSPGDRDAVGLSDRHFHDLRATTASWLHARGVQMRDIQRILRHASMSTTHQLYVHLFDDAARAAVDRLDGMLTRSAHPFAPDRVGEPRSE